MSLCSTQTDNQRAACYHYNHFFFSPTTQLSKTAWVATVTDDVVAFIVVVVVGKSSATAPHPVPIQSRKAIMKRRHLGGG